MKIIQLINHTFPSIGPVLLGLTDEGNLVVVSPEFRGGETAPATVVLVVKEIHVEGLKK